MDLIYDVAIIGGGPAGSTAAALLAKHGRKAVVIEREKFPRFHIGESLLPYSISAFERLGIKEKLDAKFIIKYGAEFATSCGSKEITFYFKDGFRTKHPTAYQVLRSDFDKMLLDNAAEHGAEVREETAVEKVEFNDEGVTLEIRSATDKTVPTQKIRARYLVDCSGRNAVVGNYFNLKRGYAHLKKFSVFAHFENVQRNPGIDGSLTRMVRGENFWFWMIPIDDNVTSVGVVMDAADFRKMKKSPEEALQEIMSTHPLMKYRMENAKRVSEVHSIGDYSYRNTSLTGDRWMLAGDAAGFIDPIFSTGVFLAILSGEQTADILHEILDKPERKKYLFARYEKKLNRVMDMYVRFVTAWYRPEFVEVFSNPTEHLQLTPAVNAVLAGNIGSEFGLWWRMQIFYLVVYVQRFFPLCPRFSFYRP